MLLTAIVFIAILSLLVLIHELGHFLAAKKMGVLVEEFGIGLPPRIWGKKIGETIYSVNALPIGGFVRLHGEDMEEEGVKRKTKIDSTRSFFSRPIWQRVVVLTAGVLMNFLLGVAVISFIFTRGVMVPTDRVHIENVVENSPASEAGLQPKDIILSINQKEITKGEDLTTITRENLGKEVTLGIGRGEKTLDVRITPREEYPKDQGPMGVVISSLEEKKYSIWQAPFFGTWEALKMSGLIVMSLGVVVWQLVSSGTVPKEVAGPVGIAQLTGEVVKFGPMAVLEWLGLISLNLAVVNILPIPALDGGRLFFVLIEVITRRRVKATWERAAHQIGFTFLIILILLITYHDLLRFNFWEKLKSLIP